MARREQVFHQFLRPLKGIGLPVSYSALKDEASKEVAEPPQIVNLQN